MFQFKKFEYHFSVDPFYLNSWNSSWQHYTQVRYGEDSIESGHELLKYTDVLLAVLQSGQEEAHTRKRLRDSLKQAQRIFTLQTGKQSKTVKEIKEKLKYLS